MKIWKAGYEILTPISDGAIEEFKHIEKIGRVCYKSENLITEDGESAKKFVQMLVNNNHWAMLEHSTLSVMFFVDRGVSHELVRHRLAGFAQESQRYVNYSKDKFKNEINIVDIRKGIELDPQMKKLSSFEIDAIFSTWFIAMSDAEKSYMELIKLGASPQIARSVLPNSTRTTITITANYREWYHILSLRAVGTTGKPHPQMLEVMVPLLKELQEKIPIVFDNLKCGE